VTTTAEPVKSAGLGDRLTKAISARASFIDEKHESAFRLFNGFSEGYPALTLEIYQRCLLVHDYSKPEDDAFDTDALIAEVRAALPWINTAVVKARRSHDRNGAMAFGDEADLPRKIKENGIAYAVDLRLNRDASFYLDTRNLRTWAMKNLKGKSVLNTFAYTGSLSVAALAGKARKVVTTDANRDHMQFAKTSLGMNGLTIVPGDFRTGDFFDVAARFNREKALFDCVILDPPFFAATKSATVDLQGNMGSLINKVRPLVGHEGTLVLVNNAVFYSGAEFMTLIDEVCSNGYLSVQERIDVPPDCVGFGDAKPVVDPAPFNHSTKIVVLKVVRKDQRR
jgi:23S rRNA (cytosine1962-C5)-methyltransferase